MIVEHARWNGEPCEAVRGTVIMGDNTSPQFWGRDLCGTRVEVLRITCEGCTFFIVDDDGQGTEKLLAAASPFVWRGHRCVPVSDAASFCPDGDAVAAG